MAGLNCDIDRQPAKHPIGAAHGVLREGHGRHIHDRQADADQQGVPVGALPPLCKPGPHGADASVEGIRSTAMHPSFRLTVWWVSS